MQVQRMPPEQSEVHMAFKHRGGSRVVTRSAPRVSTWFEVRPVNSLTAIANGASVLIGTLNAAALALRPFTIVRTRLLLYWESDQVAVTEVPIGSFGMIVVKQTATTAGIASIPTPQTEPNADFFVYETLVSEFTRIDGSGFSEGSQGLKTVVDSKSMRKVGLEDDLAVIFQNISTVGANAFVGGRFLVKLH